MRLRRPHADNLCLLADVQLADFQMIALDLSRPSTGNIFGSFYNLVKSNSDINFMCQYLFACIK